MGGRQFHKPNKAKQITVKVITEEKPTNELRLNRSDSIAILGVLLGVLLVIFVPPLYFKVPAFAGVCVGFFWLARRSHWTEGWSPRTSTIAGLLVVFICCAIAIPQFVSQWRSENPAPAKPPAPITPEQSAAIVVPKIKDWLTRARVPFEEIPVLFPDGTKSPFGIQVRLPIGIVARIYIQPEFPEVLHMRDRILLTPDEAKIWNRLTKKQAVDVQNEIGYELKRQNIVAVPVDPPEVEVGQEGLSVINSLPTSDLTEFTFSKTLNQLNDQSVVAFKIRQDVLKKYARRKG